MAAQLVNKDIGTAGSEEYPKAKRENGTFILPWAGKPPSGLMDAMKWFMTSPNNSNIPGSFYRYDNEVTFSMKFCYIFLLSIFLLPDRLCSLHVQGGFIWFHINYNEIPVSSRACGLKTSISLQLMLDRCLVILVGRALDCCAGGLGF